MKTATSNTAWSIRTFAPTKDTKIRTAKTRTGMITKVALPLLQLTVGTMVAVSALASVENYEVRHPLRGGNV